jgi:hypothetical protein
MVYPKVLSVTPLPGKRLRVVFASGVSKVYDCKPLLKAAPFAPLKSDAFFARARPAQGGYGVVWSDEVDLSESELWLHGTTEQTASSHRRGATGKSPARPAKERVKETASS